MSKKVKYLISLCFLIAVTIKFVPVLWGIYLVDKSQKDSGGDEVFSGLVTGVLNEAAHSSLNHFDLGFISIGLQSRFVDDKLDEFKPIMYSFSAENEENIVISNRLLEDVNVGDLVSKLKLENKLKIDFISNELDLFTTLINLKPNRINVFSSLSEVNQMLALLSFRNIYIYKSEKEFYYFKLGGQLEAIQLVESPENGRILLFHSKGWLAEINYDSLTQTSLAILLSNIEVN
ncbi:hypothetical protein [Pseudoalteromonas luteoviolacea]|uniref:Uncharacterized protein n=1 Tax=Pseudoalteromonas luteoviolacea S4060-1 TaxID=1365257 RepID=A0A167PD52_9GAMM|nr:hypothetical protein [Pseudoalteromonas luteoviolacea]KZN70381.1 hypothetical protein N478_00325 [Pseudoalteromonas luteoviolacea S4060-1]